MRSLLFWAAGLAAQTFRPVSAPLPADVFPVEPLAAVESTALSDLPLSDVSLPTPPEALASLSAAPEPDKNEYLLEVQGLGGRDLLKGLQRLVHRSFRALDYDRAKHILFTVADVSVRGRTPGILDPYSNKFLPGRWSDGSMTAPNGMAGAEVNPEHLWPQTYFEGHAPMRSDLHHLMAVGAKNNNARSSQPFGMVSDPVYGGEGGFKSDGRVFEPPDAAKGRIARALLYFYVHYHDRGILVHGGTLRFWNPQVETLLDWNRRFPPTDAERRRNDLIESVQHNRNPFIDDPSLADRIGLEGFLVDVPGRRPRFPRPQLNPPERGQSLQRRWSNSERRQRREDASFEQRFRDDRWRGRRSRRRGR